MTNRMYENRVKKIQELQAEAELINSEIESIKDEIKKSMDESQTDEVDTGSHIIRWKFISSSRIDTTSLKKFAPDIYSQYLKTTESRRFTIA